jgi:hypothetical protein
MFCTETLQVGFMTLSQQLRANLGDQHMARGYRNQQKAWTQDYDETLQDFAPAIERMSHRVFPA